MLDRLEHAGFIERIHSKEDRREIIIKRTEKDKNLQSVYLSVSKEMNDLFYKGFTEKEIDNFEKTLDKILDNLILSEKES